eukprot:1568883-Amphidinium_carterae.1
MLAGWEDKRAYATAIFALSAGPGKVSKRIGKTRKCPYPKVRNASSMLLQNETRSANAMIILHEPKVFAGRTEGRIVDARS